MKTRYYRFDTQFSLSIFTDFRYQSIKITWLLSIFIDADFYRLTTPGTTFEHQRAAAALFNNIFLKLFDRRATYKPTSRVS